MAKSEIVKLFEEQRPVCLMSQMVLERLLDRKPLDRLFEEVAEQQYERTLLFSSLARLMSKVVLCREKSVNSAYKKLQQDLKVSLNAVYNKLDRLEIGLSQALVRYSYAQLKEVSNELRVYDNSPVAGYTPKILDGNHLSATEHRLRETRHSTAAPLPGKSLVVLDPRREAIADMFPIEDGHAQERSGLDQVIETIEPKDLWVADRNFTTLKFLYEIENRGAKFVIRQHAKLHGQAIGQRKLQGETETGRVYEQQLELPAYEGQQFTVRRVELELFTPTRDGDSTIAILTNLSEQQATAVNASEIYRTRWRIETAFQRMTTTLQCEVNTLCYPKAALFTFSLACLAYNAISVVFTALRSEYGKSEVAELSFHYLSQEIYQAYDGMMIAIPTAHWDDIRRLSIADYVSHLREVAQHVDLNYFRKSKRGPKKPKPKTTHRRNEVHVSSAQILARRQQ